MLAVFGAEDERHIWVGSPLDMEDTRIHLDLEELVKRSNGVFGKSGTGKSFLTRILLAGTLQKDAAVNLVFDMHNEYGWQGTREGGPPVKGLKQLFPSRVGPCFPLDPKMSQWRGLTPDAEVTIGYNEIEPQDMETLAETLNLTPQGVAAVYSLVRRFGQDAWLNEFLKRESREELTILAEETSEVFQVLFTPPQALANLGRMGFLLPQVARRRRAPHPSTTLTAVYTWCWSSGDTATICPPTSWSPTCSPAGFTIGTCSARRRQWAIEQGNPSRW